MCGMHQVLALVALFVGLVHSWDVAVSVGDRLEFYTNRIKTDTVHFKSHNVTAITYDEVHNLMLFVDKQSDNDAICGYNLASTDIRCFIKRYGSNIQHLAFDPATDLLFFTDINERSINWISLKEKNIYGNVLIKLDNRIPSDIAVDSCEGYIYWSHKSEDYYTKYMERARFSGSERKVIYNWLPVYTFVFDPQTHTNYYIDGLESMHTAFFLKVDLREENLNRETADTIYYNYHYFASAPKELTVSNDYLYWMESNGSHTTVWQRSKHASVYKNEEAKEIGEFYSRSPLGIVAKYSIKEQVQGLQDCEALSSLIPTITVPNTEQAKQKPWLLQKNLTKETDQTTETGQEIEMELTAETEHTTEVELTCVHGAKVSEASVSVCKCTPGYTGDLCDVSVCENFCLQGNFSSSNDWLPNCRCNADCTDQLGAGGTNKTDCATTYAVPHSAAGRGISSPLPCATQVYVFIFIVYIHTLYLVFI